MPDGVFDLIQMTNHFSQSIDGTDINLVNYCAGYKELTAILDSLGRLMYFVLRDVDQKLGILNDLRDQEKHPVEFCQHFSTVQKMCTFEADQYENNKLKSKSNATMGSRNLLRLHRAFLFIIDLFEKVCSDPPEIALSELTRSAYDGSLAHHHPWAVQKACGLAFLALPNRQTFISNLVAMQVANGCLNSEETCRQYLLETCIPTLRKVYQITQDIYAQNNMLDLP
nr:glycolipid transfer protein domain containing protein [Hymenolepis microstoma]